MTRLYTARGQQLSMIPDAKPPKISPANRGMEFEHQLMAMHGLYKMRKWARIDKNFCPTQPLKDGRLAKVIGKAIVDFTGLTAGGRFVAFDAKDCIERRIELDRLAEHQLSYLGDVQALGGMAFVLVRFKGHGVWRIPVDAWADADIWHKFYRMPKRVDGWRPINRASLCVNDMREEWRVDGVDWLRAVRNEEWGMENGKW